MRCQYCHNPDTWNMADGTLMESKAIIDNILRNQMFYYSGGITATGGEPLLQIEFLIDLFTKAKEAGISTCLDTSGVPCFWDKITKTAFYNTGSGTLIAGRQIIPVEYLESSGTY